MEGGATAAMVVASSQEEDDVKEGGAKISKQHKALTPQKGRVSVSSSGGSDSDDIIRDIILQAGGGGTKVPARSILQSYKNGEPYTSGQELETTTKAGEGRGHAAGGGGPAALGNDDANLIRDILIQKEGPAKGNATTNGSYHMKGKQTNMNAGESKSQPSDSANSANTTRVPAIFASLDDTTDETQQQSRSLMPQQEESPPPAPQIGAIPVAGPFARTLAGSARDFDEEELSDRQEEPTPPSSSQLVVANPILDESSNRDLPQAQGLDEAEALQKRQHKEIELRNRKRNSILLGVFLLIGVVLVVIVVSMLLPRNDRQQQGSTTALGGDAANSDLSFEDYVLSILPSETASAILEGDTDAPQAKSFSWLLEEEELYSSRGQQVYDAKKIRQRYALATFYYAASGHRWANKTNWLSHEIDECEWYNKPEFALASTFEQLYDGYMEGLFPPDLHTTCNSEGHYQHLWLDQNRLKGEIPNELLMLTSLLTISMALNRLQGTLPSHGISQLTALEGLIMTGNLITGTIPSQLGQLTKLRALALNRNNLEGRIPSKVLSELTNMDTMHLGDNSNLGGTIPSQIGNYRNARWLLFDRCDLSGTIPTEIGLAQALEWLIVVENRLSGPLPSQLGQLDNLLLLTPPDNLLSGSLPSQLGLLSSAYSVSFRDNQFSGHVPTELGMLTNLGLSLIFDNNPLLTGTLPSQFGALSQLRKLSFLNTNLSGSIPSQLGRLTSLERLTLQNNSLVGTISTELSTLATSLHTFGLEGNTQLSGEVPSTLCTLQGICTTSSALSKCKDALGFTFDCSSLLCGCNCTCEGAT